MCANKTNDKKIYAFLGNIEIMKRKILTNYAFI